MYWVYSLPNWFFEVLTVAFFMLFSVAGTLLTRKRIKRIHVVRSCNDIVGFYLAGLTVLYGVTLGLLAIGAWTIYTETEAKVAQEAASVSSLYRTVVELPEPMRTVLETDLRHYVRQVIDIGWPLQQRGIPPLENRVGLDQFQKDFQSFTATNDAQRILEAEISRQYDVLEEARNIRVDSVTDELPSPLWTMIFAGALICIAATWFFHMESLKMHLWMTILLSALLGMMVYMVAALDNPYRGKISVSPESLERVYMQMNRPGK